MILAILQIRVSSEGEKKLADALLSQRRSADEAAGFLAMEAFVEASDSSVITLVTRWTDSASFDAWRAGLKGRLSDGEITRELDPGVALAGAAVLERSEAGDRATIWEEQTFDSVPLLARYLKQSRTTHYIVSSLDGTIRVFNEATALHLKVPASQLEGLKLWSYLSEDDAGRLWRRVQSGTRGTGEKLLINFVDAEHFPYALECYLDVQPDYFTLIGELPRKEENVLREHLLQINNQLAVLTRENAQKSKALEKSKADLERALNELNTSYWHMRKISEYLPICMQCHKVRTAEAQWENVADYLNKHSLFLTHSLCPPCYAAMMEDVNRLKSNNP